MLPLQVSARPLLAIDNFFMEWLNVARLDLAAEPCSSSSEVIQRMGDKITWQKKKNWKKCVFLNFVINAQKVL